MNISLLKIQSAASVEFNLKILQNKKSGQVSFFFGQSQEQEQQTLNKQKQRQTTVRCGLL